MANRNFHLTIGGISGGGRYLLDISNKKENIHIGELMASILGGVLGGVIPDYLDPPTSPNHRALAHSVSLGGGLIYKIDYIFKFIDDLDIPCFIKCFLKSFIVGYLSHLVVDSRTTKSLPLLM